jgi:20S proteasome subunit alpha 5
MIATVNSTISCLLRSLPFPIHSQSIIYQCHQNHWFLYDEKMSIESVTQSVSNLAIQFGDSDAEGNAMSRPFGVAMLFAGIDLKGPQLYYMDPSGTYVKCDAKAIGSGCEGAQQALQEAYHKVHTDPRHFKLVKPNNLMFSIYSLVFLTQQTITNKEAIKIVFTILKQVMEEKLNSTNVEVATIIQDPNSKFGQYKLLTKEEVEKVITEVL